MLRIRSVTDAIAAVPYLLGFRPNDSVVLVVTDGSGRAMAARLDLDSENAMIDHVARVVGGRGGTVIIVGYGPDEAVTPVVDRLRERLETHPVKVPMAARVDEGRYWCYICPSADCSHNGAPIDNRAKLRLMQHFV